MARWEETETNKLLMMRAAGVPFALIAKMLGRTENACHTKYYNTAASKIPKARWVEVMSDPVRYVESHEYRLAQHYKNAIGRTILRGVGLDTDGKKNTVHVGDKEYPIMTIIGRHLLLGEGLPSEMVLVWLSSQGTTSVYVPLSCLRGTENQASTGRVIM